MSQQLNSSRGRVCARRLSVYFTVLAALFLTLAVPSVFAQVTHVSNPYVGATVYASPDYTTEVGTAIAAEPAGSTLASQMAVVGNTPTFVWLDRIAAIYGGSVNNGRLGLQGHINAALAQQQGTEPVVVQLVIYDLPDRDCAALASNGELSIAGGDIPKGYTTALTGTGIEEYENDYITPIYNILAQYATNPNIRFVLVIEDDSLPNLLTNTGVSFTDANCVLANAGVSNASLPANWTQTATPVENIPSTGVYYQGITFAANTFHQLPNVYNYLDIGHHGWLGWTSNTAYAVAFFSSFVQQMSAGYATIDGFITNTANYGPLTEPYIVWDEVAGGPETDTNLTSGIFTGDFYQWDPAIDELSYKTFFLQALTASVSGGYTDPRGQAHTPGGGFPSTIGFLIDTSRNGWGNTSAANGGGSSAYQVRPTAAGTSTVIDTFVNESKIDLRNSSGQWCNQENVGIGEPPTVTPTTGVSAYVWVKPPGEADGNYPGSTYGGVTATDGDPNCNPVTANPQAGADTIVNSIPNPPPAGTFWLTEFVQLVEDANPVIQIGSGFSITATSASGVQGTPATSSVTVNEFGSFNGAVTLALSQSTPLPTGVTAAFSPATVTGSAGSTLTITISATAIPGTYPLIVIGSGDGTTESASLSLTVVSAPTFTIIPSSTTVSLPVGTNPTDTFTIGFQGGLTGSVSVSATGQPSGMQVNFSPSSVNAPGGTIVANFSAQSSTPAGSYPIQIVGTNVGTNGTITNSVPITVTIPGSGFTLAPSPTSLSIAQGSSGTDAITVTDLSGFTGSVTLAATGLPVGVTATFGTNPTTATSVVTFTVASTTAVGTYPITITGTSGSLTPVTTSISLTVTGVGYTLSASPATLSVTEGGTGTSTITVTDVGTFTGGVTLAASGLPTGVTATFGTNPATASSVVTFTVAATTVAGTYPITITGTSGTLAAVTTSINLTVTGAPGYTLSALPATLSVTEGGTGTSTITITDKNGFSGSVSFAASGLPAGVTAAFSPTSSASSSVVTFTVASTTAFGTYPITITGTSGTLAAVTTSINLTVANVGACNVIYTISPQNSTAFGAALTIQNTSTTALTNWTLTWSFANGQTVSSLWNGIESQSGANVTVTNEPYNGSIPAGGTATGIGFNGTWNGVTNAVPTNFAINGTSCGGPPPPPPPSFTLAPSVSTLSIAQGASGTDTITVTDVNGFNGSVTLAASGLPTGVTAAFGTNPAAATSVVTITVASTTTAGTYPITITGTSGTLTPVTTSISLVVPGAPNYTLSASPATVTSSPGSTGTSAVTVTDQNGFTGSVTLAATGLPAGVTAAFGTNPATATSVITFTVASTTAAGTYPITITGTSGTLTPVTISISLTVTGASACTVDYGIASQWPGGFGAALTIINNGSTALSNWTLTWSFANGQTISQLWSGIESQSGANVTVTNEPYNGSIPAGGSLTGVGFNGTWNSVTNAIPTAIWLNGTACTVN